MHALEDVFWLFEIESIYCSEYGSRCNELDRVGKPKLLRLFAAVGLAVAATSLLFYYSEIVPRHSERSLPCDF